MEQQKRPWGEALHQEKIRASATQITLNELQRQIREKYTEIVQLQKRHKEMIGSKFYHYRERGINDN